MTPDQKDRTRTDRLIHTTREALQLIWLYLALIMLSYGLTHTKETLTPHCFDFDTGNLQGAACTLSIPVSESTTYHPTLGITLAHDYLANQGAEFLVIPGSSVVIYSQNCPTSYDPNAHQTHPKSNGWHTTACLQHDLFTMPVPLID